jgi:hypothetical protein
MLEVADVAIDYFSSRHPGLDPGSIIPALA